MSETDPARPAAEELTAADLELLGAKPLHRSDPTEIGEYRVLARLGGGGMGRIFLGRYTDSGAAYGPQALVAIKVIRPEYAEDASFRRRFEREIEAVRRVHGDHTAGLLSSGFDEDERLWMATAYVAGLSLADAISRFGPLPAPVVWRLTGEIGGALAAIADAGIVHRDLKPSNVLLGKDGARVIDFGVAHTADTSSLTMTGQQVGTPAFMSPEQANGGDVTVASDVFSLGSVLALALTGTAPFGEGSTGDVIHRVIYSPPSDAVLDQMRESDPELAELIGSCLAKDPAERPSPQEIIALARERTLAREWPDSVAAVIESRADWSGPTVTVSPVDQVTILRRPPVAESPQQRAARRRRWPLVLAGGVVAAAVLAVIAFVPPSRGTAHAGGSPGPKASTTSPAVSGTGPSSSGGPGPTASSGTAASPAPATTTGTSGDAGGSGGQNSTGGTTGGGTATTGAASGGGHTGTPGTNSTTPPPANNPPITTTPPPSPSATITTTPVSTSCTGWTPRDPNPGTYGYMSGNYHLESGPYQACTDIALATTGTKLWYHCYVVNAYGHTWTYVRISGTNTSGWMSNDNLTGQTGPSTHC